MGINFKNLIKINEDLNLYPNSKLLIVTKNQNISDVNTLIDSGYRMFGENRVQEAKSKYSQLNDRTDLELHLIGPLQRNKVKVALQIFDVIQTIDRFSIVDEIYSYCNKNTKIKTKKYFIQVNIGQETQKSGISPDKVLGLFNYAVEKNLNICGLMCIPPISNESSSYFQSLLKIKDKIDKNLLLSMGMSQDYSMALNLKSNIIRIGSLIFL